MGTYVLGRIIRAPADEGDFAPGSLAALELVADIEDGVTATNALLTAAVLGFGVDQLLTELRPVAVFGGLLDYNLLPVIADLVDDVFDVLSELELVECADALRGDGDTAGTLVLVDWAGERRKEGDEAAMAK